MASSSPCSASSNCDRKAGTIVLEVNHNLIFTVINLLVLFIGLRFTLFKPVQKILQQRQEMVERNLADAEKAKSSAEALERARLEEQQNVAIERAKTMATAQQRATEEYERILSDAREKADSIVKEAEQDARQERDAMLRQAQTELTALVMDTAARAVVGAGPEGDSALYDQFLQKAGELDGAENR